MSALPPRGVGAITPTDCGQTVYDEHFPLGADGILIRSIDRSEPSTADAWTIHRWRRGGRYEPQNGRIGCWRRGRRVSATEAARLLLEVQS